MVTKTNITSLISQLTLRQKARLLNGVGMWQTKGYTEPYVPSIFMCDGPHGLRKQGQEQEGNINSSAYATCYPTACASASSWNVDIVRLIGESIGEEAKHEQVSIVLGPGVNIKRSPLCGRNFEYYSEDPYLAGRLANAWVNGVQSRKVGTSLKHFAVNGQEHRRMTIDTIVDERALREIYLSAFEYVVKNSQPSTIMAAYNKINGTSCTQNKYLLDTILRKEWKYKGAVVSDWGATYDIVQCIKNGMDLEMPYSYTYNTQALIDAVNCGEITEKELDHAVSNVLKLACEYKKYILSDYDTDYSALHAVAKECATECGVLVKNTDKALPLVSKEKVLFLGELAEKMRFQGAGSSHIRTQAVPSLIDALKFNNCKMIYAEGYRVDTDAVDMQLREEAIDLAKTCDKVVICCGLTDESEGEGYDRTHLLLPHNQVDLIEAVVALNKQVILVTFGGSPFIIPCVDQVKSVLCMYLAGQGVGEATQELLYGVKNPSGKLAESWPMRLEDTPCYQYYANTKRAVQLRESIFVGYRYYDTFNVPTQFCFGHGLSYTQFKYSAFNVKKNNKYNYTVSLTVKNVGKVAGKEVVQLYIANPDEAYIHAKRELKGFCKTDLLNPGEQQDIEFSLDERSFSYYDCATKCYCVAKGSYTIEIGSSLNDIRCNKTISVAGQTVVDVQDKYPSYFNKTEGVFTVSDQEFTDLVGAPLLEEKPFNKGEFTIFNCLDDMKDSFIKKTIIKRSINNELAKGYKENSAVVKMTVKSTKEIPLCSVTAMSNNEFTRNIVDAVINMANGKTVKGLACLVKKEKINDKY
ncbi:MAG: glycoside hydrolase family 3 C-terminal domain-containing protein [Clostridia bacterium]|nr:glycoside hydrolase family 3 C-terminal domain-containing protein [Clostridia bacterium]